MTSLKIFWEKQQSGFCGVHCVNNLLQNAYFTEVDFSEIALALDKCEKQLMMESGTESSDFLKYMAEDSNRVNAGGNFSVQVLRKSLETMGLQVINAYSEDAKGVMENPVKEEGFVCHLLNHWFSVRKLNGHWFNLNSIQKKPTYITPFFLSTYLQSLKMEKYMIYVIKGSFPKIMEGGGDLSGRENWFNAAPIIAAKGGIALSPVDKKQTISSSSAIDLTGDDALKRVIEASRKEEQERLQKEEGDEMEMAFEESELLQAKQLSIRLNQMQREEEQKEMEMALEDPELREAIKISISLNKPQIEQKKTETVSFNPWSEKDREDKKTENDQIKDAMEESVPEQVRKSQQGHIAEIMTSQDPITIRIKLPRPSTKVIVDSFSLNDTIGNVKTKIISSVPSLTKSPFVLSTTSPPVQCFKNANKTLREVGIRDRESLIVKLSS